MSLRPMSISLGPFKFFLRKAAEIFANECLSLVSTTPAINLSPVSLILVTDFQGSLIPAINLLPVTTTPVIRVCGVSMDLSFHGG
jgi:hypothetical protein